MLADAADEEIGRQIAESIPYRQHQNLAERVILKVTRLGEVAACHLPQTLDQTGDHKFGVLPGEMPGRVERRQFSDHMQFGARER
jgi:hypothetical protein